MALSDPTDTLAFHLSRPLSSSFDASKIKVPQLMFAVHKFMQEDELPMTSPESEALWFYGMNHGMAAIRTARALYEPLGELQEFVEGYYEHLSPKAVRAFYYLLLICTREARHLHNAGLLQGAIVEKFGTEAWAWTSGALSESQVHVKLMNEPPAMELGVYVDCLRYVFYEGKWGGGYGGKAWGQVADCLCQFVHGAYTAEMMLDTIWTLCHNNGPIFNKGHLYGHYSADLQKLLDIQRSGQILPAVLFDQIGKEHAQPALKHHVQWLQSAFPSLVVPYVDWFVVEALGSVEKYPAEKKAQLAAHGASGQAQAALELAEKQKLAAMAKAQALKAIELQEWFEVQPGVKVKKLQRDQLAA